MSNWMQMFGHKLKPPKPHQIDQKENSVNEDQYLDLMEKHGAGIIAKMEKAVDDRNERLFAQLEAANQQSADMLEKITGLETRLKANEDALNKWLTREIPGTVPPINTGPAGWYGTAKDYC